MMKDESGSVICRISLFIVSSLFFHNTPCRICARQQRRQLPRAHVSSSIVTCANSRTFVRGDVHQNVLRRARLQPEPSRAPVLPLDHKSLWELPATRQAHESSSPGRVSHLYRAAVVRRGHVISTRAGMVSCCWMRWKIRPRGDWGVLVSRHKVVSLVGQQEEGQEVQVMRLVKMD